MENKKLSGAKFVLLDKCGNEIACGVTNDCGEIIFDCLPLGHYFLKEIEAPCGYEKSDNCVEVCIDCHNTHRCVEFINKQKRGCIKVVKLGCGC